MLQDKTNKCLVEAVFDLQHLQLQAFFKENDLEYDAECILTREISVAGKSRAFINDSPVNLLILKSLGEQLVDIHSQHDSLHLTDSAFQLQIIDGLANNDTQLKEYEQAYSKWLQCKAELNQLKTIASDSQAEIELIRFQLDEFQKLNLKPGEFNELNQKAETLSHAEEIGSALFLASEKLNRAEANVVSLMREAQHQLLKASRFMPELSNLAERLESTIVEVKDIASDTMAREANILFDPLEIEKIQLRLSTIKQLMLKHRVLESDMLLQLQSNLIQRLEVIEKKEVNIGQLSQNLINFEKKLEEKAQLLSQSRKKLIPEMERSVRLLLTQLGMPNGRFEAVLETSKTYGASGADQLSFLFTANKGGRPEDISRVASGGELSRLMLAIKSLTSGNKHTPTIIFDEIDTGVSGDIAAKVGRIMASMAHQRQLIAITHLPQIAGKAANHLLVYKRDDEKRTRSLIIHLSEQQRIEEIARMLSDDVITAAARTAARELMIGF